MLELKDELEGLASWEEDAVEGVDDAGREPRRRGRKAVAAGRRVAQTLGPQDGARRTCLATTAESRVGCMARVGDLLSLAVRARPGTRGTWVELAGWAERGGAGSGARVSSSSARLDRNRMQRRDLLRGEKGWARARGVRAEAREVARRAGEDVVVGGLDEVERGASRNSCAKGARGCPGALASTSRGLSAVTADGVSKCGRREDKAIMNGLVVTRRQGG